MVHATLESVQLHSCSNVSVSFDAPSLSEFGGATLLAETFDQLGWRDLVRRCLPFERVRFVGYSTEHVITSAVMSIALGARRPEHVERIRADPLPGALLGCAIPSSVTIWRHLYEYALHGGEAAAEALDRLNLAVVKRQLGKGGGSGSIDLDIDGTVCTVYGEQEGAEKGYNPTKKGKRSYFPLLAVCVEKQLVFGQDWRPGDSGSAIGDRALLDAIWDQLPQRVRERLRIRADSAHFDGELMSWCEDHAVQFVIKARQTTALMAHVRALRFEPAGIERRTIECAELSFQSKSWSRARRCVIYREVKPDVRDADGLLFKDLAYEYTVIATSLPWAPAEIWKHYNARGEAENLIEDLKNSIGYGAAATAEMLGNRVWSMLQIIAFNLLGSLRSAVARVEHVMPKVRTLRERLLRIPAKIARHSRRALVRLKQSWTDGPLFRRLLKTPPTTSGR